MKKVGLIVPYDYTLLSIGSILDVLEIVNKITAKGNQERTFGVTVFQSPDQIRSNGNSFHGYPVRSIRSNRFVDIVFIPALATGRMEDTLSKNSLFLPWLRKQHASGAEIASFCTGAFLFGATGLLDGKQATTHVDACCTFASAFPKVFIKPGDTITADGSCYTSGSATAAFHLLILLIQKYCGDEVAIRVSKYFAVDLDRYKQSHFSIFRPDYSHHDELVKEIQKCIERDFSAINTIDEILKNVPSSRRNIVRRFKHATGLPPIEYLQQVRMEKSKKLLEQTNKSISEIVAEVGYADPKSFRKTFNKIVGITPLKYREKFKIR